MLKSTRRSPSCGDRATDHISMLPDDCLTGIFSHLNHIDVDEMSVVSKRMLAATLEAERKRWRARECQKVLVHIR
uniref:F-box domain-containing protein n=1 Tax=Pristionchus pacificus TaxID=54126 RepID=A0A2A6BC67_PRIPA